MIYLAKRCETLDEFKKHKFSTMLALGKYEEYDEMECFEIENGFYGNQTLTDVKGRVYKNWHTCVLKNLNDGTQIQMDFSDDEHLHVEIHIEIFNIQGKVTYSIIINKNLDYYDHSHSMFIRPSGIGKGMSSNMDDDFNIIKRETTSCGWDVLDFDPDFLNFIDEVGESTYKPFLRGGREKYSKN